jgi:two-component system, sensor histidine kinase YesM
MKIRQISYRLYLFYIFSSFVIVIISVFFLLSYYRNVQSIYASQQKEISVYADSVAYSLMQEMDVLSTISMNIVYSAAVRDSFNQFIETTVHNNKKAAIDAHTKAWNLSDYIFITFGAFQKIRQVNLYSLNGYSVSVGDSVKTEKIDLAGCPWYKPTIQRAGKKFITLPFPGKLRGEYNLSLIRLFYDNSGQSEGIAEVVQDCSKLFKKPAELQDENKYIRIYVLNSEGQFVFPYTAGSHIDPLISPVNSRKNNFIEIRHLDNYYWSVYLFEDKAVVAKMVTDLKYYYFLLMLTVLIDTTIICFIISNQLTTSINKLSDIIKKFELEDVVEGKSDDSHVAGSSIREITLLWETYSTMKKNLVLSTKKLLLLKSEETKMKLQLSQSFVEPHFLYNILNNISVMAEDHMDDEITDMCELLTSYLRYVTKSDEPLVTIEQELEMTRNYLDIMKVRYGQENFSYKIYCPDDFLSFSIPKFVIQPLTENIFKYAFIESPPWKISIVVESDGKKWTMKVTDNGGTLSNEKRNEILAGFSHLDIDMELKDLHIGGSGLKNTYIRLVMRYKEQAVFDIVNSVKGYTTIVIGGLVDNGE